MGDQTRKINVKNESIFKVISHFELVHTDEMAVIVDLRDGYGEGIEKTTTID